MMGVVLALLLAFAAQLVLVPFIGTSGSGLRVTSTVVFYVMLVVVIGVIVRGIVRERRTRE